MSTELGNKAEEQAAHWLADHGFTIRDRNWRNRWCEIDIVAAKNKAIHFVEVKYRKSDHYGIGFEYITADKQQRLRRAAQAWVHQHKFDGPFQIDAIAITARNQIDYLENIIN